MPPCWPGPPHLAGPARAGSVCMCRVNACRAVTRQRMLSTPEKMAWPDSVLDFDMG